MHIPEGLIIIMCHLYTKFDSFEFCTLDADETLDLHSKPLGPEMSRNTVSLSHTWHRVRVAPRSEPRFSPV